MHLTDWIQFLLSSQRRNEFPSTDLSSRILVSGEKHPSRVFIFREHLFCDCIARNPRDSPLRSCNSFQVFTRGSESPPISRALRASLSYILTPWPSDLVRYLPPRLSTKIDEMPEDGNPAVNGGRRRRRRNAFNPKLKENMDIREKYGSRTRISDIRLRDVGTRNRKL